MAASSSIFRYGTVIAVNDELDGGRIKVFVKGLDPYSFKEKDIPYAFPLLPKTVHTQPKVGEKVLIFTQNGESADDRFWIGPLVSQPDKIAFDPLGGQAFLTASVLPPGTAPSTDPDNVGVSMDPDDVGFNGRGSTDFIVKPDEIRIRAGKSLDFRKLNKKNPAYIQVKYNKSSNESSINIVSDVINLLSYKGLENFNLVDSKDMINSEEYKKIIQKAHKLPYGDILVDFLDMFIKAFTTHVHAYAGLPPDLTQIELKNLLEFELDKILAKNIRIN
jgi:hypothetical protein